MASKRALFETTVMQKYIVAFSGLAIVGFLIAHLAGNLLIYSGPASFNKYAQGLKDLGLLLWLLRAGTLTAFVLHIVFTLKLKSRNLAARPDDYKEVNAQASTVYSRSMTLTGLSIFTFVLFHLAHFTWGKVQPDNYHDTWMLMDGRLVHNAYTMTVAGFHVGWISALYLIAVTVVFFHLNHAVQSSVQTLGFNHPRYRSMILRVSQILSIVLWLGFASIPVSVLVGFVK